MAVDPTLAEEGLRGRLLCDLYVGKCSTGKSTYCKARARAKDKHLFVPNHSTESGTSKPVLGWASGSRILLLDTQGLQDSKGKKDEDIGVEMLRKIDGADIDSVRIVWCVTPNDTATDDLQKQAAFIVSLLPKGEDAKEFWANNVLIIVKDQLSARYKRGPVAAAVKSGADKARVKVCAIRILDFLEDEDMVEMYNGLSKAERMNKGVVRQRELAVFQEELLREVTHCRLVKRDDICVNCGMTGDMRLWRDDCHALPFERVHIGSYRGYGHGIAEVDLKGLVKYMAPREGVVGGAAGVVSLAISESTVTAGAVATAGALGLASGVVVGAVASVSAVGAAKVTDALTSRWTCCQAKRADEPGCTHRCSTCSASKGTRFAWTSRMCSSPHLLV